MYTLYEESSKALSSAIKNGVIDTDLSLISNPFLVSMLNWMPKRGRVYETDPTTFEPQQNAKTLRWQEEVLPAVTHDITTNYFAVELARFTVPKGRTGYLQGIDQVLNDVNGNYYPSNKEYWGSPHFVDPDVDNCRWFIRMDAFDGQTPARFQLSSAALFTAQSLPALPFTDLHEIPGLWYPAHCGRKLNLIVPGNRMLRFFFYSPPTVTYQWQAMGRLSGYTQSTYAPETKYNTRTIQ